MALDPDEVNTMESRSQIQVRAIEGQKMNIQQGIESYVRYGKLKGRTASTLKWYVRRLGQFKDYLAASQHSMQLADVRLDDGEAHITQLMEKKELW